MSQNHDLANALLYELFNTEWLSSDNNLQSHLMQNYSKKHDNLHGHLRWGRSCTQSNTISWKETDNVNIMQISSSQTHTSLHNWQNTYIKLNGAIFIIKIIIVYFACGTEQNLKSGVFHN